jgi:hypothetical protein
MQLKITNHIIFANAVAANTQSNRKFHQNVAYCALNVLDAGNTLNNANAFVEMLNLTD